MGVSAQRGAQIARDEINATGGILGRPVELVERDDQLSAQVATQRFEELVTQQKVLAVLGGFLDETVLPIVNGVLPRVRTVFLNTGTATPETTERLKEDYDHFKFYFRLMLDTDILTEDTVNAAQGVLGAEAGVTTAALLVEDDNFGRDFQSFLESKLPGAGIAIAPGASLRFANRETDFRRLLSQVGQTDAQALIVAFIRNNGIAFVRQWFDLGPRLPVLGINVSGQAFEYWNDTQGKTISHIYADAATGATAITERTLPFFQAYTQRFTTPPRQPLFTAYLALLGARRAGHPRPWWPPASTGA